MQLVMENTNNKFRNHLVNGISHGKYQQQVSFSKPKPRSLT